MRNVTAIMTMSCNEVSYTSPPDPVDELDFIVEEGFEKKYDRPAPTWMRGIHFDPPLNLNAYVLVSPFPSKFAKGVTENDEVQVVKSS